MADAYVAGTGVALPTRVTSERFFEVDQRARRLHGQGQAVRDQVRRIVAGTQIASRHSVSPVWHADADRDTGAEDIFTPYDFDPPVYLRAREWTVHAPRLALRAARAALADWGGDPASITHVVTTSTSGWSAPGLALSLQQALGLGPDTGRIELNYNGCFCGGSCIRTARDIVRGGESGAVLVVAVELASVQYNPGDTDPSALVTSALFGDGAGAMVVAPEGRWQMPRAGMSLIPDTADLLRLSVDLERESNAYKLQLHPEVPRATTRFFAQQRGARILEECIERAGGFPALAVHPGGPSILEGIDAVLRERGWADGALDDSFATLRSMGNLGSAAILVVLDRVLKSTDRPWAASLAFGPGLSVEWALLRRTEGA